MTRAALNWILDSNHKQRRWIAGGIVLFGLAGINQQPHAAMSTRPASYGPAIAARPAGETPGMTMAPRTGGYTPSDDGAIAPEQDPSTGQQPVIAGMSGTGVGVPVTGGFVPTPAPGDDQAAPQPSGDSVPESVNTNFDDYIRGQQRVNSENDGQTYIVDGNADPNHMTDTRDSVSGFTQADPGAPAAGYAQVAPTGDTTVDASNSTPVETSSASSSTTE